LIFASGRTQDLDSENNSSSVRTMLKGELFAAVLAGIRSDHRYAAFYNTTINIVVNINDTVMLLTSDIRS